MSQKLDYTDQRLEQCRKLFCDSTFTLAALAATRRREVTAGEACTDISRYTAELLIVSETRISRELNDLARQGYVERKGDRYHITTAGKNFMFDMIKVWNLYVDAMNNLWGCYYGA
jgi:DNA-binding PadR family transcriptional regulator